MNTSLNSTDAERPMTLSICEAGRLYFGLSRNTSYRYAAKGLLPVVRVGTVVRCPIKALDRMLDNIS